MFAKIVQKWNMLKSNWNEYQRLRGVVARAWRKLEHVREEITTLYNVGDVKKPKSCIRIDLVSLPTSMGQEQARHFELVPYDNFCVHFRGGKNGKNAVPCTQTHCPFYNRNSEYVAAAKELEAARENCRTFWSKRTR